MEGDQEGKSLSFEEIWGADAAKQLPPVGLEFRVQVHPKFYLGPLLRAVTKRQGGFGTKTVTEFCTWALSRHFESYRGRRSPIEAERRALLLKAVPARPLRGRGHTLVASLDPRVRDETVARLLDARFQSLDKGKSVMFREALFEAVRDVLEDAERAPVGAGDSGAGDGVGQEEGEPGFEEE